MPELMNPVEFRTALENAIKGKSANKAPFSIAWASGKLSRDHLARWAENHYHYVGPFADYLAYIYAKMPERIRRGEGLPSAEHVRGRDRRRPPHRPPDPLRRGLRHDPRAGRGSRQHDRHHARPAELVLRGRDARGPDRRRRRPRRRPRIAGAVDLPPADARRCARSTASPTRRSSSSTCTSSPTRSTASAATRSCSSTPARSNCSRSA